MSEWISVDESVPENTYEDVIVFPRPTDYCVEAHHNGKGQWFYGEYVGGVGHETYPCKVTHWMPLPPPPTLNK